MASRIGERFLEGGEPRLEGAPELLEGDGWCTGPVHKGILYELSFGGQLWP